MPPCVQDIATASTSFDMAGFVPQLREYLTVLDSKKRMFLISWVTVLASVPDIDMLAHLPELLAGLLDALQDDLREVRTAASKALQVRPHAVQAHCKALMHGLRRPGRAMSGGQRQCGTLNCSLDCSCCDHCLLICLDCAAEASSLLFRMAPALFSVW